MSYKLNKSLEDSNTDAVHNFYESSYKELGFRAQRKYPNEELCRFMGRNFFAIPYEQRKEIKILETGCGSGSNLWMIAKEGFDAYGIDLAAEAIILAKEMLKNYEVSANLSAQDMANLSFPENFFDAVVDVFSSYCLTKQQYEVYLKGVKKVLKPGGLFFSYFPSKMSDTYLFPGDANFLDSDTLEAVVRNDSPFCGQNYPFRFIHPREYESQLKALDFTVRYSETTQRTYRNRQETFGFIVIEAKKD